MKKITLLLVIIFTFLFSNTSWGEWTYVAGNSMGHKMYYDKDSIRKSGNYIYFWGLYNLPKLIEGRLFSSKSYVKLDCSILRYKFLSWHYHKKPMAGGLGVDDNPSDEWRIPTPNGMGETFYKKICGEHQFDSIKKDNYIDKEQIDYVFTLDIDGWEEYINEMEQSFNKVGWSTRRRHDPRGSIIVINNPDGSAFSIQPLFKEHDSSDTGLFILIIGTYYPKGSKPIDSKNFKSDLQSEVEEELGKSYKVKIGYLDFTPKVNLIEFIISKNYGGDDHKDKILYGRGKYPFEWREFGEKETNSKYKGEVENGKPNGLGTMTYPDGRKYWGEFKDGKLNGQGTRTTSYGEKYEGEWKDGLPNGKGTMTWSDGEKYVGEFKGGNFWNGTTYEIDGNFFGKWVNGKLKVK